MHRKPSNDLVSARVGYRVEILDSKKVPQPPSGQTTGQTARRVLLECSSLSVGRVAGDEVSPPAGFWPLTVPPIRFSEEPPRLAALRNRRQDTLQSLSRLMRTTLLEVTTCTS